MTTSARLVGTLLACMLYLATGPTLAGEPIGEPAEFAITLPKQRINAPEFRLPDFASESVTLDNYRGKVVLLHFWATFCLPCRDEMPALEYLWQHYGEAGLVVVGIAADRGSVDTVRDFAAQSGLTFPIMQDASGDVRNRYEVTGLPTSYVIGRDGKISGRAIGSRDWSSLQAREFIESLL